MKYWLLVSVSLPLVVLAKPGDTDKQAYCASLAAKGECNFYDQCIEQWTQTCGKSGYALGYGGKYCRKFDDNLQLFNTAVSEYSLGVPLTVLLTYGPTAVYCINHD